MSAAQVTSTRENKKVKHNYLIQNDTNFPEENDCQIQTKSPRIFAGNAIQWITLPFCMKYVLTWLRQITHDTRNKLKCLYIGFTFTWRNQAFTQSVIDILPNLTVPHSRKILGKKPYREHPKVHLAVWMSSRYSINCHVPTAKAQL